MESSMEVVLEGMEAEHIQLNDSLRDLEAENNHLVDKVNLLEKALEKEKKFHRKYADEVVATEAVRIEDYQKEKRATAEEMKLMVREIRQLKKDVDFYKKAHEELAKEDESKVTSVTSRSKESRQQPVTSASTSTSQSSTTISYRPPPSECTHKSSKVLSKINDKLFGDNKKLKLKITTLSATIATLKKKNKQLENFRSKIDNKKTKFCQDSEELERLVALSQKNNGDTFNPKVLAWLESLI